MRNGLEKQEKWLVHHQSNENPTFLPPLYFQYRSIASVVDFLQSIRRAYLSLDAGPSIRSKAAERGDHGALDAWKGVTSLTDKERDEIEFQVKVMIKRCLGRIQELEKGEEGKSASSN